MNVQIRRIRDDEVPALVRLDATIFGWEPTDELIAGVTESLDTARAWFAVDGDRPVAAAAVVGFELTVPGGAQVAMGGVTWVGVLGTHRRRGILRRLMSELASDIRDRGELAAGLCASESLIYRRFGFGRAERIAHVEIETRHSAYRQPWTNDDRLEIQDRAGAEALLPGLHDRMRRRRNGMLNLPPSRVRMRHRDADRQVDGASRLNFVVHRGLDGEVDGLAGYRLKVRGDTANVIHGELRLEELWADGLEAEAALWRFCFDHDLVERVVAGWRPADETVADLLLDPRRWRQTLSDGLHLSPVDVSGLLAARRYGREDGITIEVLGSGRYRLQGGLAGAGCVATGAEPDLVIDPPTLGSIYLGDTPVERLWRAGLVEERTAGAVARATAMFSWSPPPWSGFVF